jgi:hypothetical protein
MTIPGGSQNTPPKKKQKQKKPRKIDSLPLEFFHDPRRKKAELARQKYIGRALDEVMFHLILEEEKERGGFFTYAQDGFLYHFNGETHRLNHIGDAKQIDMEFTAHLTKHYGLIRSEQITRHIVDQIDAYTRSEGLSGERPDVKRFAFYDRRAKILYISGYNGTCYKLNGDTVEVIPNGKEVLFVDDDKGVPVENPEIEDHGILSKTIIEDLQYTQATAGGLSPEDQKTLFTIWTFAIAFGELLPGACPILLLEGEKGSGKSFSAKRVQLLALGREKVQIIGKGGHGDDFGVTLLRSPIALLDNLDSHIDWFSDAVAAYTTGGEWSRRKLYTDSDEISIKPRSFIIATTRNARAFQRDDVADRCIILRLDRRTGKDGYKLEDALLEDMRDNRPKLFGEWLFKLNKIVKRLSEVNGEQSQIRVSHRLSDFANLSRNIGEAIGLDPNKVSHALNSAQSEREELTVEDDPLVPLIDYWLSVEDGRNAGTWVTANELHSALSFMSFSAGIEYTYAKPSSLGNRLRNVGSAFQRYFQVEAKPGSKNNAKVYRFSRNTPVVPTINLEELKNERPLGITVLHTRTD